MRSPPVLIGEQIRSKSESYCYISNPQVTESLGYLIYILIVQVNSFSSLDCPGKIRLRSILTMADPDRY